MIRLVSQFDDDKARASVATPTCGPCCSCSCCCIATALTSSIITARNFGKMAEKQALESGLPVNVVKSRKMEARFLGFFILPVSIYLLWMFFNGDLVDFISGIPIFKGFYGIVNLIIVAFIVF
ncbi:MAG: hypothetical protein NZM26_01030 [Patescibacteria group bacterium]|nr:hypothetical protein [Patescibacteria group bacterium]